MITTYSVMFVLIGTSNILHDCFAYISLNCATTKSSFAKPAGLSHSYLSERKQKITQIQFIHL